MHQAFAPSEEEVDYARREVEAEGLASFDLIQGYRVPTVDDWREVPGVEVRPPDVWRYFGRVRPDALARFAETHGLDGLPERAVEDEFVYRQSFLLNRRFYASLGEQRAFVLSHGRDLLVFKIVGYAEQAVEYGLIDEVLSSEEADTCDDEQVEENDAGEAEE